MLNSCQKNYESQPEKMFLQNDNIYEDCLFCDNVNNESSEATENAFLLLNFKRN